MNQSPTNRAYLAVHVAQEMLPRIRSTSMPYLHHLNQNILMHSFSSNKYRIDELINRLIDTAYDFSFQSDKYNLFICRFIDLKKKIESNSLKNISMGNFTEFF
jgi:hypothetical protein